MSSQAPLAEEWRPSSFNPKYSVSDRGRVRGPRNNLLSLRPNHLGYVRFSIPIEGVIRSVSAHALVMDAFVGARPDGMTIDHINGNKSDNRVENLRYLTAADNIRASSALGLNAHGERHGSAKLNPAQVTEIRRLRSQGLVQRAIARRFGISQTHVRDIISGKNWAHV